MGLYRIVLGWTMPRIVTLALVLIPCWGYGGTPHLIFGKVASENGGAPGGTEIEIYAYNPMSPDDFLDGSSTGCGFSVFSDGWLWFEAGNLARPWAEKEAMRIIVIDPLQGETGATDIVLDGTGRQLIPDLKLSSGDHVGPVAHGATVYDANRGSIMEGTEVVLFSATVDDLISGNSAIQAVEYFVDDDPGLGLGTPMDPRDGAFDSPLEDVWATVDASRWDPGSTHVIYVRGKDSADNWGTTHQAYVSVVGGGEGRYTLAVQVFIDTRCDRFFKSGVDRPLAGVPVTMTFPDGVRITRETRGSGVAHFSGFDPAGGIRVTTEMPREYDGYPVEMCPNSYVTYDLGPEDFGALHNRWVDFRARIAD